MPWPAPLPPEWLQQKTKTVEPAPPKAISAPVEIKKRFGTESPTAQKKQQRAMQYLSDRHSLSKEHAAAITANLYAESRLDEGVVNSIGATGIAQWLGERKTAMQKFTAGRPDKFEAQLDFLMTELKEKRHKKFFELNDMSEAAAFFSRKFERHEFSRLPVSEDRETAKRVEGAKVIYQQFEKPVVMQQQQPIPAPTVDRMTPVPMPLLTNTSAAASPINNTTTNSRVDNSTRQEVSIGNINITTEAQTGKALIEDLSTRLNTHQLTYSKSSGMIN